METDGEGCTLVWSYTFTDYDDFTDDSNAVTPRLNWPANAAVDVSFSTTPPFMKQTKTGTGSLFDWQGGSVSCQIVKRVTVTRASRRRCLPPLLQVQGMDRCFLTLVAITTLMVTRGTTGLPIIFVEQTWRTTCKMWRIQMKKFLFVSLMQVYRGNVRRLKRSKKRTYELPFLLI